MSYFKNKLFNTSEKLKPYDAFEKKLPISYTEGCIRHIASPLNRQVQETVPNFGHIIVDSRYEESVNCALYWYKYILAQEILTRIYGDDADFPETMDDLPPELADEIIMRYYPSHFDWVISSDSRGVVLGTTMNPREFRPEFEKMIGKNPEDRKYYFSINKETGLLNH